MKPLKSFIKKIFRSLGYDLRPLSATSYQQHQTGNIVDSIVAYPKLVDAKSRVQFSELRGEVKVGPFSVIHKSLLEGNITIGRNSTVNGPGTEFYALSNPITIGNFCSIARGTSVQEYNHNWKTTTTYFIRCRVFGEPYGVDTVSKGAISIGNDVWIGTECVILTGVTIGDGAVVAANSVVSDDVPPYAIVAGSPAKIIRYRFTDDIIQRLLAIKWWLWDHDRIKANPDLFNGELTLGKLNNVR
jgi:virginiamycin A acetyltransferase